MKCGFSARERNKRKGVCIAMSESIAMRKPNEKSIAMKLRKPEQLPTLAVVTYQIG